MTLTDSQISIIKAGADNLKGSQKRLYVGKVISTLGWGAKAACMRQLGWSRHIIDKGTKEHETGIVNIDKYSDRGRLSIEKIHPNLRNDIDKIVFEHTIADPTMKSDKAYLNITGKNVYQELLQIEGYNSNNISARTIRKKLNDYGYKLRKIAKTKVKKNSRD